MATKQQYIEQLEDKINKLNMQIDNMYSVAEYKDMKSKLEQKLDNAEMMLQSTHIMKAYLEGQVNTFERFADFIPNPPQCQGCDEPLSCFNH